MYKRQGKLSLPQRPSDVPGKQAASAVGQCELMYVYDKEFEQYHHVVAQMLLTSYEIENDDCRRNIENTLQRLMDYRVLPIVNENDTVATEELGIGENDTLSAIVATLAKAALLVILSAVSYTHLDVYKRQTKTCGTRALPPSRTGSSRSSATRWITPPSTC